jgi:hypothetical protein
MAFTPHAVGIVDLDYMPNADRQIEASSRRRRCAVLAVKRVILCDREK